MASPHLLLVDDDPDLGLALAVLARRASLRLSQRHDVPSAYQALCQERPDLVLLDINLPGQSGLELLRQIRQHDELANWPVALFCHSGLAKDIAAGWAAGANYLVAKDLVSQGQQWQGRIAAILQHVRGQLPPTDVGWLMGAAVAMTSCWGEVLRRTLARVELRALGVELGRVVLRRTLVGVFGDAAANMGLVREQGRLTLVLPRDCNQEQIRRCLLSIRDQLWCLFGPAEAAAFVEGINVELQHCRG